MIDTLCENKKCPRCGEIKPLSEFYVDKRGKDGLQAYCKICKQVENARRKAKEKGAVIEADIDDYVRMLLKYENHCWFCGSYINGMKHIDHITPLSKGGAHSKDNLAIMCHSCNQSKCDESLLRSFMRIKSTDCFYKGRVIMDGVELSGKIVVDIKGRHRQG